jgi:hypothetical protein
MDTTTRSPVGSFALGPMCGFTKPSPSRERVLHVQHARSPRNETTR